MVTESAAAGTSPPAQLVPTLQAVEVAPVQARAPPVTLKPTLPLCVPSVTVTLQVANCTPVATPAASTLAHPALVVPHTSPVVAITAPTLFLTTAARAWVSPGWRLPSETSGRFPSRVM